MDITYKTKDIALHEISEGRSSKCSKEVAAVLELDEYISVIRTNMGDVYQITPKRKAFLESGGYTSRDREKEEQREYEHQRQLQIAKDERKFKWKMSIFGWIITFICSLVSGSIGFVFGKLFG